MTTTPKTPQKSSESDKAIIFAQLESEVYAVAISPDGRKAIAGLSNGQLRLFDLITGNTLGQPFVGHTDAVNSVAFSPDGQTIVSGSDDQTLRLWDINGNALGQPLKGHSLSVLSVAFSSDGQTIVSGSDDQTLRLWDINGNTLGQPFVGHSLSVESVAFSPDGQTIVSGSYDKTLRLWDIKGNTLGQPLKGHTDTVKSVAFSPDGQTIVSGSSDGTLRLWDIKKGNALGKPFVGHSDPVNSVAFSPDGQTIVSGSSDETLRLWDIKGNVLGQPLKGHIIAVNSVAFSPDGQTLVSGSYDKTLRLWDIKGYALTQSFAGHTIAVSSVAFSPDGQTIVSGSYDKTLRLWDIKGYALTQSFVGHTDPVLSVAFSPDGETLVSGSSDGTLRLWDIKVHALGKPFEGHTGYVELVAFSPDGQTIVSGSSDGTLRLWDIKGNALGQPFVGHSDNVYSVAFSPDGQTIVSGSRDNTLRLWDIKGNALGQPLKGHSDAVLSVAFSPDGQTIVSGSSDGTLRLWDIKGNALGQPLKGHSDRVLSVAFSPDGQTIVSGSSDGTLRLWDIKGNALGQPLKGHSDAVLSVAFSPDGQTIVSGSSDGILRLWNSNIAIPIPNLSERLRRVSVPQSIANDATFGDDQLNVKDEIEALAEVLMLRTLQPPIAVALLGSWGSGKSFGMHLIQRKVNEIRGKSLIESDAWGDPSHPDHKSLQSPDVGHIYQITFNAWTYAKSNLWASLMQEIFFELNRQISLEKQLGKILCQGQSENRKDSDLNKSKETSSQLLIDRLIYNPWKKVRGWVIKFAIRPIIYFLLQCIRWVDLILISLVLHLILLPFIILLLLIYFLCVGIDNITPNNLNVENIVKKHFPFVEFWVEQIESYYFRVDTDYPLNPIKTIIENVLFLLFAGFPERLKDRNQRWQRWLKRWRNDQTNNQQNFNPIPSSNNQFDDYGDALRKGGKIWECLYVMNEDERNALLRQALKEEEINKNIFEKIQKLTTAQESYNDLWQTLNDIRTRENQQLQQAEQELNQKEQALQLSLKNAELEVDNQLSRKANAAYWKPLINIILRLKFDKKQIQEFSASGETLNNVPKAITSLSGLIALFLVCILLVLYTKTEILTTLKTEILAFIDNYQLLEQGKKWITVSVSGFIALIPTIKLLGNYLEAVIKERKKVKSEREIELKKERKKSDDLAQQVTKLKQKVAQKRQNIGITANYSSLMEFVTGRLENEAYGQHLGLMRQVQKDLEDLSRHLTVNNYNRETLKQLFPRGPARVIIYIDDLDRCPPDRVVEVLETVQLLLKTELFIVVLAVDDRYIARALEQVYTGVLKRKGKPSGIDYLEKIIQIPYRMRPISPDKVENYLRSQVDQPIINTSQSIQNSLSEKNQVSDTKIKQETVENDNKKEDILLDTISESDSIVENKNSQQQDDKLPEETESKINKNNSEKEEEKINNINLNKTNNKPKKLSQNKSDEYLQSVTETTNFDEELFNLLIECCKPIDITPRTAKRLINITKILQIIWSKSNQYTTLEEKRIVIAFLALSGRYPNFMRYLFDEIDVLLEEWTFNDNDDNEHKKIIDNPQLENINFQTEILEKIKPQTATNDYYFQREWRRFTSDLKRTLLDQFEQFSISRRSFNLTLSFSFVGDIGYDPEDYSCDNSFPKISEGNWEIEKLMTDN